MDSTIAIKLMAAYMILNAMAVSPSDAHWKPEYASQPPEVQQWYQNAELTPAAQAKFGFQKCCAHSDVVHTQFKVNKTSGADEWFWLDGDTWKRIPPEIIHPDEHAPDGQPTLFVYEHLETCFFPPQGGI